MKNALKLLSLFLIISCLLWACQENSDDVQPSPPDTETGVDDIDSEDTDSDDTDSDSDDTDSDDTDSDDSDSDSPDANNNNNPGNTDGSKLGIWLWYLEIHEGYKSHAELAAKLAELGADRVYVKVADGRYLPNTCSENGEYVASCWAEIIDTSIPEAYNNEGIECWAWAYNYPGNNEAQAEALYESAKTGYQGFVTDIEIEFDGKSTEVHELLQAFTDAKTKAQDEGYAPDDFKFYCTTWGNPKDHNFRVDIVDQYVDAHMPQTYLEVWGQTYMNEPTRWVNIGTEEYRDLGCEKPIHHIVSAEHGRISADIINEVIHVSGAETSIWRIPGGEAPLSIWDDLAQVTWDAFDGE